MKKGAAVPTAHTQRPGPRETGVVYVQWGDNPNLQILLPVTDSPVSHSQRIKERREAYLREHPQHAARATAS